MYWKYFKYVVRHKWYVLLAGLRVNAPLHRLIIHDWSKFMPSEFIPYTRYFYGVWPTQAQQEYSRKVDEDKKKSKTGYYFPTTDLYDAYILGKKKYNKEEIEAAFDKAWLLHQRRNKHHWQYWLLIEDSGDTRNIGGMGYFKQVKMIPIPEGYLREMAADWAGAGRAITGKWEVKIWYLKNQEKIVLDHITRKRLHQLIDRLEAI